MKFRTIAAGACIALASTGLAWADDAQSETVMPKFEQAIPNIPGKSIVVVEVDYGLGGASQPHRHAKSAFIYAYV
ncbi:cupin domain-containing protein, partial [Rhizobiaceae sp. 2RAB30]